MEKLIALFCALCLMAGCASASPVACCREQTASQRNAGTFANSAAIVRAMEPVPRMPIFIGAPLLIYNGYQTLLWQFCLTNSLGDM